MEGQFGGYPTCNLTRSQNYLFSNVVYSGNKEIFGDFSLRSCRPIQISSTSGCLVCTTNVGC